MQELISCQRVLGPSWLRLGRKLMNDERAEGRGVYTL